MLTPIKNVLHHITGGRPMKQKHFAIRDSLNHEDIFYFEDAFGRVWMAARPWSFFRVRVSMSIKELEELDELFAETFTAKH